MEYCRLSTIQYSQPCSSAYSRSNIIQVKGLHHLGEWLFQTTTQENDETMFTTEC